MPGPRSALMLFLVFYLVAAWQESSSCSHRIAMSSRLFLFFICAQVEQFSLAECAAVDIASYAASRLAVGVAVIIHHLSVGTTMDIHTIAVDIGNLLEVWLAITIG